MEKEQLVAVVERAHALWNQSGFTQRELKSIHAAWWDLLKDFDFDVVLDVLRQRAIDEGPMPRPGELRRLVIDRLDPDPPPSPAEAWVQLRAASRVVETGTASVPLVMHDAVREAMHRLGGPAALTLHTNGDREVFCRLYESVVRERRGSAS